MPSLEDVGYSLGVIVLGIIMVIGGIIIMVFALSMTDPYWLLKWPLFYGGGVIAGFGVIIVILMIACVAKPVEQEPAETS